MLSFLMLMLMLMIEILSCKNSVLVVLVVLTGSDNGVFLPSQPTGKTKKKKNKQKYAYVMRFLADTKVSFITMYKEDMKEINKGEWMKG